MNSLVSKQGVYTFLSACSILIMLFTATAHAAMPITQKDIDSINKREYMRDSGATSDCPSTPIVDPVPPGSSVYMLGDSITEGAEEGSGNLLSSEITAKGLTVGKINGVSGRAITAPGSGTETGLQAIDNDAAIISTSSAIIIALGTNPAGANAQGIKDMIAKIKTKKNATSKIYWVNIFSGVDWKVDFNNDLNSLYVEQGFTIIDTTSANIELSSDGVHPTPTGYGTFASTVIGAISSATSSQPNEEGPPLSYIELTVYSPQQGGDEVEGGYESARNGLDGEALVRTLDDVKNGSSDYVTLAGDPSFYEKTYKIPTITYDSYESGQKETVTLTNILAYVHDTGSAFIGEPEGRYDVAVGKDYTDNQMNSQPFANYQDASNPRIQLIPTTATETEQPVEQPTAGCTCSAGPPRSTPGTRDENFKNTWDYLITERGLSKEAAAGLMGNLDAESDINPWNVEDRANNNGIPDGPEIPIDAIDNEGDVFRGKYGYGIAQWTFPTRQDNLINFATGTPVRSTGDLLLQLDFLWHELTNSYTGVLAVLQKADVTIEEASDVVLLEFERPAKVLLPPEGESTDEIREQVKNERRGMSIVIFNDYSGLPPGSYKSSGCAGQDDPVLIDPEDPDTSDVPCSEGTTDAGVVDGYADGKKTIIRICNVSGVEVNSVISQQIKLLFDKSSSDGLNLGGGGYRSMEGQIGLYKDACAASGLDPTPPPYPKASWEDNVRCPGAAAPGYSNHQTGYAIDFSCNGVLIDKSYDVAKNNECFQWLLANANNYGLFEYGKGQNRTAAGYEAWHWSIDGN